MQPLHEWEVQLAGGNSMLLHNIASHNETTGHFWIWGGLDHHLDCHNDHFSFSSAYLHDIDGDDDLAWQVAHELLSLFNGAISLVMPHEHRFRLLAVVKDGYNTSYVDKRHASGVMGRLPPSARRGKDYGDSAIFFRIQALACEHQDAYHLVKLFEQDGGWVSYYKILETIESYTTKYKVTVPVDEKIKKRLELTANNFSLSGFDSRHGFKQLVKDIKTPPLSLDEASRFIRTYAQDYLFARYGKSLKEKPAIS
ncbi:hypothetical protein ACEPT0_08330 [Pseudomonas paraeruginosa]|uniref:hypothetical protein n=1 Tax=Pseudomonas paraeruginosa TaxID=2994495 RepID=UPI003748B30B